MSVLACAEEGGVCDDLWGELAELASVTEWFPLFPWCQDLLAKL